MSEGRVSPTFTGELPVLTMDMTTCELGAPCAEDYVCRIHQLRRFLMGYGMILPPAKAAAAGGGGADPR